MSVLHLSCTMEHCIISIHRVKPHVDGLVSIDLRNEATNELLFQATADKELEEGYFFVYDSKGVLVGTIQPESIFGLSFMLYSYDHGNEESNRGSVLYEGGGAGKITTGRKAARMSFRGKWEDIFGMPTPIDFDVTMGSRAIDEADRRNSVLPSFNFKTNMAACLPVQANCMTSAYTDEEDDDSHLYHWDQYQSLSSEGGGPQSPETLLADTEMLATRSPVWNTEVGAFLSNFGSRVKKHERSNFILISSGSSFDELQEAATVMIRFGRVLKNKWILDFRTGRHLTPLVAFSCALTSLVRKPLLGDF